jgi:hypothetical protein
LRRNEHRRKPENNGRGDEYTPPAVVLVQLDDLEQKQLERVRPAAFLILRTSPKERGYQAWLAVKGGDREFTSRLKRGTGADLNASGSVRMAGTGNYKRDYKASFPTVAIEEIHPGRVVTREQLESMGLPERAGRKPNRPHPPFDVLTDVHLQARRLLRREDIVFKRLCGARGVFFA